MQTSEDHIYTAEFVRVMDTGLVLLDIDLGFGIRIQVPFRPYLDGRWMHNAGWEALAVWLSQAEEILVKSIQINIAQYYGDITFRRGDEWYNATKLLVENNLVWER